MRISARIKDDAPSDEDHYDRVHGRYQQGQDHLQDHHQAQDHPQAQDDYLQSPDDEPLELANTNDWWRLLLPNPWMEVSRH